METKINHIRNGNGVTVIVINGFLSESKSDVTDWLDIVDQTHQSARVIHLDWPASNVKKQLMAYAKSSVTRTGLGAGLSVFLPPIGVAANLYSGSIARAWAKSIKNTEAAGEFLARHINATDEQYIIMGHSLGARVIYHTLRNLRRPRQVNNVYLLGGAVGIEGEWENICRSNKELKINNLYSYNDSILKYLYKAGTLFKSKPIGRNQIIVPSQHQVVNADTSHIVEGHMKYKCKVLGDYICTL